jgi:hypothetical protein
MKNSRAFVPIFILCSGLFSSLAFSTSHEFTARQISNGYSDSASGCSSSSNLLPISDIALCLTNYYLTNQAWKASYELPQYQPYDYYFYEHLSSEGSAVIVHRSYNESQGFSPYISSAYTHVLYTAPCPSNSTGPPCVCDVNYVPVWYQANSQNYAVCEFQPAQPPPSSISAVSALSVVQEDASTISAIVVPIVIAILGLFFLMNFFKRVVNRL